MNWYTTSEKSTNITFIRKTVLLGIFYNQMIGSDLNKLTALLTLYNMNLSLYLNVLKSLNCKWKGQVLQQLYISYFRWKNVGLFLDNLCPDGPKAGPQDRQIVLHERNLIGVSIIILNYLKCHLWNIN